MGEVPEFLPTGGTQDLGITHCGPHWGATRVIGRFVKNQTHLATQWRKAKERYVYTSRFARWMLKSILPGGNGIQNKRVIQREFPVE